MPALQGRLRRLFGCKCRLTQHIQRPLHLQKARHAPFNRDIAQLCQEFAEAQRRPPASQGGSAGKRARTHLFEGGLPTKKRRYWAALRRLNSSKPAMSPLTVETSAKGSQECSELFSFFDEPVPDNILLPRLN